MVLQSRFHFPPAPVIWFSLLSLMLLAGLYSLATAAQAQASTTRLTVTGVSTLNAAQASAGASAAVATSVASKSTVAASNVPGCTPIIFNTPSAIDLTNAPSGLSVQNDQPSIYQIYGDTAATLRTQIVDCGPGANGSADAEFTGQADYQLEWQYDQIANGTSCTLQNVKVGLHTTIAMPYWQPTSAATSGLGGRWQQFVSALLTHEHGHIAVDTTYAGQTLSDLSNLGTVPCSNVVSDVNTVVTNDTNELNTANNAYDAATNHGATQGAILPTY